MKTIALHSGSASIEVDGVPPEVAALLPKTIMFDVKLEDIDKDGDSDVVFYVAGAKVYSIQASTLADNVRAEFGRVPHNLAKLKKKLGGKKAKK